MDDRGDEADAAYMSSPCLSRLVRRVIGTACLCAIPGVLIAMPEALPEVRILGLAITVTLIGAAGLSFTTRG